MLLTVSACMFRYQGVMPSCNHAVHLPFLSCCKRLPRCCAGHQAEHHHANLPNADGCLCPASLKILPWAVGCSAVNVEKTAAAGHQEVHQLQGLQAARPVQQGQDARRWTGLHLPPLRQPQHQKLAPQAPPAGGCPTAPLLLPGPVCPPLWQPCCRPLLVHKLHPAANAGPVVMPLSLCAAHSLLVQ